MKTIKFLIFFWVVIILGVFAINTCTFTVAEMESALVIRLGEVKQVIVQDNADEVREIIKNDSRFKNVEVLEGAGLRFKTPFLESVKKYESRYITLDTQAREVTTKDKKKVILDNNAQWRIDNPLLFHISMGNYKSANTRIDDLMYSKINERVGRTEAATLISDKVFVEDLLADVKQDVANELNGYGIEVLDVRIKKTDLPKENSENIYNRMRTEREQMAKQYRSEGKAEATRIKSEADAEARIIVAEAEKAAKIKKGEAEAEATRIYNEAYGVDPEFYSFYKSLNTYRETIDDKTKLVIDSNSPFAKFLFGY